MHAGMLSSQDDDSLHGKDIQLIWKLPSNNTHIHTRTHTQPSSALLYQELWEPRCAVLEFTSDSFCWSLNTSFPFGLCLSPLSLRLLMIGTSMSSVCIFHGRLGSLPPPPRIVHTGPVDSSRLHRVRRGGPTPESQVEDLLLLLLLLLLRLPPSRYVWFAVPARTERAELKRVASADTWNQNDVSVLKWRLNGSKY